GILDRVRVPVGGPEREKEANPVLRIAIGLPEILIEAIADRPAAARAVKGSGRDQQVRKPACEDLRQNRAWVRQEGELLVQQQVVDIRGVLVERKPVLVVPCKADALVTDEPERID